MRLQPFRDDTLKDAKAFRIRLNELVDAINSQTVGVAVVPLNNVQAGMTATLASPEFTVGAISIGTVRSTSGGAAPTAAPWVTWQQRPDGQVSVTVNGLAAAPALYFVSLVLHEAPQ